MDNIISSVNEPIDLGFLTSPEDGKRFLTNSLVSLLKHLHIVSDRIEILLVFLCFFQLYSCRIKGKLSREKLTDQIGLSDS